MKGVQVCGVTCLSGCPWGAGSTAVQYGNWVHSLLIRIFIQETDVQFEGDTLGSLSPAVLAHTHTHTHTQAHECMRAGGGSEGLKPSAAALISLNGAPSAEEKTLRWWSHTRHYWDKTPDQIQPWWAAFHQRERERERKRDVWCLCPALNVMNNWREQRLYWRTTDDGNRGEREAVRIKERQKEC